MEFNCALFASEALKLGAQFAGALLIAWLAVRWALARYKAEKMWERRLGAYADLVLALGEMRRVNRLWFDDSIMRRERPEDFREEQEVRWKVARRRLEEVVATGQLLLPQETMAALDQFEKELEQQRWHQTREDALDDRFGMISNALNRLTRMGRADLGID